MFEELKVGLKVHYVQPNGSRSVAEITKIHNQEYGVVDLLITRDDTIKDTYNAQTVVFREKPVAYSWHWIEKE